MFLSIRCWLSLFCTLCTRCRLIATRVASHVWLPATKRYGSCQSMDRALGMCLHVGGGGLIPDFTREPVQQMRTLLYFEAPFQSEMLQSTTASDLLDARSTHENVPQTDDPLFLGPDLAEHADRMKIKQNNKMSSKILPRTQRMVHCLCQVRGPQKPPGQYHGGSRTMTSRQQIRDGNHSGGPGSHCCLALLTNLVDR